MKYFIILSFLFVSCASIQPLSGGDKDELPPDVINTSIDSAATHVTTTIFYFDFNEYVQLKQAADKLLISPNQSKPPTITVKKKRLSIELNDDLIPNTTYTFQFNGAITDINENNPLSDYNFIFSTGSYLDSAAYNGVVINYITKDPCIECNVHLYDNYTDTTLLKVKPSYLTRTDKTGAFSFHNLPNKLFTSLALSDDNNNLYFENNELISIPKKRHTDTTNNDSLYVFVNKNTDNFKLDFREQKTPGVYQFISNKPLITDTLLTLFNKQPVSFNLSYTKDTITIIYTQLLDTLPLSIIVASDTFNFKNILIPSKYKYTLKPTIQSSAKKLLVRTKTPILSLDTSKIKLLLDSINSPFTVSFIDTFSFYINTNTYYNNAIIHLKTGAITDIYKKSNTSDTLVCNYKNKDLTHLKLTINTTNNITYILHILNNTKIIKKTRFIGSKVLTFHKLQPSTYQVIIYSDSNNNGIWDTGNVFTLTPPESVTLTKEFELRQNWDKNLIINIK
jgi:hypothetical protein